jgi:Fungal specific transcription factor domain
VRRTLTGRAGKCDGNLPKCAACASVYLTECEYAPHTDHRRKGVYKKDVDSLKTKNSTLQVLVQAILNAEEDDVAELVRQIRTCDSLEELASAIEAREKRIAEDPIDSPLLDPVSGDVPQFEAELSGKMGDLWLDGSVKFIGGTSNLIWMPDNVDQRTMGSSPSSTAEVVKTKEQAILSWTTVTQDKALILHFINMYFCWHYAYFTTLSKELFYRDFLTGTSSQYCSALLVNVMLALGCHFSSKPAARADPEDSSSTGDHFFKEAKRLLYEDDEFANAKLCTVQALALMSVREAGCGHESKGWVYSGMSFRMAYDLGLNIDAQPINDMSRLSDEDIDARRVTFWGCFLFDKCWSNYLGRQPQVQISNVTVKKPEVFPSEDSEMWSPYTDAGIIQANAQPARTRAVALQISKLAEISGDLLVSFYNPQLLDKPLAKQAELKKLSDIHTRLEAWKTDLPSELDVKESQLPQVLLMHMFYQLLYIHLYRPFLKYTRTTSPLPSHVSPRKFCTQAAGAISKLFRLYKRTHGLRQICNIAIYIAHTACTIHILNLPDKNAKRDIVHGVKHLEEMGDCWTAARRTMSILNLCAQKWKVELPEEAEAAFARARLRWGMLSSAPSPGSPGSFHNMGNQSISNPVSELLAQNIRRQQEQLNTGHQIPYNMGSSMAQVYAGLSAGMAPSPSTTVDTRRSSGNMSLPPQNAADLSRGLNRIRPSTQLTKEQQDAWHAHQARLASSVGPTSSVTATAEPAGNAARLFGGIDSLMEDSQDWWFKDQAQLASGFDNWTAPTQDWFGFDASTAYNNNNEGAISGPMMDSGQFGYANGSSNGANAYSQFAGNGLTKNKMIGNGMNVNNGGYGNQ